MLCSTYCRGCSIVGEEDVVPLCPPEVMRDCLVKYHERMGIKRLYERIPQAPEA